MRVICTGAVNPFARRQQNVPDLFHTRPRKITVIVTAGILIHYFKNIGIVYLKQFAVVERPEEIRVVDVRNRSQIPDIAHVCTDFIHYRPGIGGH